MTLLPGQALVPANMFRLRVASHLAATPALLDVLAATGVGGDLAAAVVAHPNTAPHTRDQVLAGAGAPALWGPCLVRAAATLPGELPAGARDLLADSWARGATIGALAGGDSRELDMLIERARHDPDTRHTIVPAVIDAPAATPAQAAQLAAHLGRDPQPQPAARTWIRSLLERHGGPEAVTVARELTLSTLDPDVRSDLVATQARLAGREQDVALLTAQVHPQDDNTWSSVLRQYPHLRAALARTLLRNHPNPLLLRQIYRDPHLPVDVRREAYTQLPAYLDTTGAGRDVLAVLIAGADTSFLEHTSSRAYLSAGDAHILLTSPALTPRAVQACWDGIRHQLAPAHLPPGTLELQVATHPATPPATRALAARRFLRDPDPVARAVCRASAQTPTVRDAVNLPAHALGQTWTQFPGVNALLDLALQCELPRIRTAAAATALSALGPAFTGSIGELINVAEVVAT